MLLFSLLESGALDAARGDVIVFNNTSAEHPETYRFVDRCQREAAQHGVPFFLVEFQTYEDCRRGEWTRLPTYRLATAAPHREGRADVGLDWRGEVYEELLSWAAYVPNQFRRSCTKHLKLEPTRQFLADWLRGKWETPRLGHHGTASRIDPGVRYRIHREHGGTMPEEVFRRKHAYCWSRRHAREAQRYNAFWPGARNGRRQPARRHEHVTLIGLRSDEHGRVRLVQARSGHATAADGEHVYMPLYDTKATTVDVERFWRDLDRDLALPAAAGLSNCVYCFLKGGANLERVHTAMVNGEAWIDGFGPVARTPSDVRWWRRIGALYERDLDTESRGRRAGVSRIGFFGARRFEYDDVGKPNRLNDAPPAGDCVL